MSYVFNHVKDTPDTRDYRLKLDLPVDLPRSVDLRTSTPFVPPILNQGALGCCTGNEISNALRYVLEKDHKSVFQPSRLFIYYYGRLLDGSSINQDTGITIRSGLKSVAKYGTPTEIDLPYKIENFAKEPSVASKTNALQNIDIEYLRVTQTETEIKKCLNSGFPIILGIQVYSSFTEKTTMKSGVIKMPNTSSEKLMGGHCVALYGYNDTTQQFLMMNSWGSSVGQKGWFYLPYRYVLSEKLTSDLWAINSFDK